MSSITLRVDILKKHFDAAEKFIEAGLPSVLKLIIAMGLAYTEAYDQLAQKIAEEASREKKPEVDPTEGGTRPTTGVGTSTAHFVGDQRKESNFWPKRGSLDPDAIHFQAVTGWKNTEKLSYETMQFISPGVTAILNERYRQVTQEGWAAEHDEQHKSGELAEAASCYIHAAGVAANILAGSMPAGSIKRVPNEWPWDINWWKPSLDPIRNLEKAGALIAAEIDRRKRLEANKQVNKD